MFKYNNNNFIQRRLEPIAYSKRLPNMSSIDLPCVDIVRPLLTGVILQGSDVDSTRLPATQYKASNWPRNGTWRVTYCDRNGAINISFLRLLWSDGTLGLVIDGQGNA